jgi:hypothetical protein
VGKNSLDQIVALNSSILKVQPCQEFDNEMTKLASSLQQAT